MQIKQQNKYANESLSGGLEKARRSKRQAKN